MKIRNFIKEECVILIICFLVFIITFAYAFYFRIEPVVDARAYDTVAMNIISGRGFRFNTDAPVLKDYAITYQGPLYQYFLAVIYFIFGHHYEVVWAIQAFLRALSALLLFLICKRIFGEEGRLMGWITAVIFGFYPDLIEISAMLLTETFFIFWLILFLYFFVCYRDEINTKSVFLTAFSLAGAFLTRSTVGFFLLPLAFYFWKRKACKQLLLFVILFAIILTPWIIRNYLTYHRFLPTMANFGFNLWYGNREGGDGESGYMEEITEAIERYGIIDANNYGVEQFKEFVLDHPLNYIGLTATRAIKYFSFIRPLGFWFYQRGLSQFIFVMCSALASVILFTFGFAGIFAILKKERKNASLIYLVIFAFLTCASIIPIIIETRYRLPIYPFMAIFAGFFIARMIISKKEYLRYLIAVFLVLSFSSVINVVLEYNKILEKIHQVFG